jgi:hypothetical protein
LHIGAVPGNNSITNSMSRSGVILGISSRKHLDTRPQPACHSFAQLLANSLDLIGCAFVCDERLYYILHLLSILYCELHLLLCIVDEGLLLAHLVHS